MKVLFIIICFSFLVGCVGQGVDRNYIISHTNKEEIASPPNP